MLAAILIIVLWNLKLLKWWKEAKVLELPSDEIIYCVLFYATVDEHIVFNETLS